MTLKKRKPLSEETKRKISMSLMGHSVSKDTREKLSESCKGKGSWLKGKYISEEYRKKLSEGHKGQIAWNKGKKLSQEHRKKLSESHKGLITGSDHPFYGKHHSEETCRKISESRRGKGYHTKEFKDRMSLRMSGGNNPSRRLEVRKKISVALTGKPLSEGHKEKLVRNHKGFTGRHHSEETIKRMSSVQKGKKRSKEFREKIMGENNPAWNGGSSFLPYPPEWTKSLKQLIKDRDNNECQNPYCDSKTDIVDIHHINYNKGDCSQFNLITLCRVCNVKANSNRNEWKHFYKKIVWSKY